MQYCQISQEKVSTYERMEGSKSRSVMYMGGTMTKCQLMRDVCLQEVPPHRGSPQFTVGACRQTVPY